jgi:hypothetical protein
MIPPPTFIENGTDPGRRGHVCTLAMSIRVLFIALLCGVSLGMYLYKRSVCRTLADAMALSAWDIVCAEPLDDEEAR